MPPLLELAEGIKKIVYYWNYPQLQSVCFLNVMVSECYCSCSFGRKLPVVALVHHSLLKEFQWLKSFKVEHISNIFWYR